MSSLLTVLAIVNVAILAVALVFSGWMLRKFLRRVDQTVRRMAYYGFFRARLHLLKRLRARRA